MGRGAAETPFPPQTPVGAGFGHTSASRSLPQLQGRLFMNQELAWLLGGSFLMSKTFKTSLNGLFSDTERSCLCWLENSDWFNGFF